MFNHEIQLNSLRLSGSIFDMEDIKNVSDCLRDFGSFSYESSFPDQDSFVITLEPQLDYSLSELHHLFDCAMKTVFREDF